MQQLFRSRIFVILVLSIVASIAWTIACGQDLNFDLITYHFYLGYSGFTPRFQLDFLPAGFYGYQSPLPFIPLYWLDRIGMPPVGIALLYATFHALNLVLLYFLTELLFGKAEGPAERAKVIAFWLLGAVAPVYWTLVGTSFADLSTSVLVLAGLWLVARGVESNAVVWLAVGGAIIGVASGARAHNGIYVGALLFGVALAGFTDRKSMYRASAAFSLAAFAGWLLSFGPWAYKLHVEFGNPVFPLFNGVFRSPDFPTSNLPFISFAPGNFRDLLTLPFRMASDAPWVYVELPLPDVRPALLAISLLAFSLMWLLRRARRQRSPVQFDADASAARSQRVILIFFAVSGALWLMTSANGRFGVALFLLAGPLCGMLLSRLLPARYTLLLIGTVILWQGLLQENFFRQYRFNSMPWTARYFDWTLSDRLAHNPATFVSFGFQPGSTLAPRLHPESSHIDMIGHPAIDAPGSERIKRLISFRNTSVYGVFDVTRQHVVDSSAVKRQYTNQARLWGLDFTEEPCELVMLKPLSEKWAWLNQIVHIQFRYRPPAFLVCSVRASSRVDHERALAELEAFKRKLLRFGATCPQYFNKPVGYVHSEKRWEVTSFASSEVSLRFEHDGSFYLQQLSPPHVAIRLGRVTREEIVADEPDCRKWFSRLSEIADRAARSSGDTHPGH